MTRFTSKPLSLARRIVKEGGPTTVDRARFALKLCLVRPPRSEQVHELVSLFDQQAAHFRRDLKSAEALASDPLGPLPKDHDPAELAAWTVIGNVLLNLDGVLTKG